MFAPVCLIVFWFEHFPSRRYDELDVFRRQMKTTDTAVQAIAPSARYRFLLS